MAIFDSRPLAAALILGIAGTVAAQGPATETRESEQRTQMEPLAKMDGLWRGEAWRLGPDGKKINMIQTERIGSMLDGAVKVIEGIGYDSEGAQVFHALATLAYDPAKQQFSLHSHAEGRIGDFVLSLTEQGYMWEIPAGPMKIRYTSEISDTTFLEYGDRIVEGNEPVRFFEMRLSKIGETDWPSAGAVKGKE